MAEKRTFKIIFCHYGVLDGGDATGFTRSFNLAKELALMGHNVFFFTTQQTGLKFSVYKELREGVKIYAFPEFLPYAFRKGGLSLFSTLLKIIYISFIKADIVHSDTGHRIASGLPCWFNRKIYKSKYFSEWWEHFGTGGIYNDMPVWYKFTIGVMDNFFEVRNRKNADGCIAISHKLKERAISEGIPNDNILILNGGADVRNISFFTSSAQIKKKFNLPVDYFTIGLIGINDEEIENNKNLFSVIESLNHEKYNVNIIATGNLSKQCLLKYSLNEKSYLNIFGWMQYNQFCELICSADIFSLIQKDTIRNQSRFPNKLGDYLAAARPILANNVGDIKYYSENYPDAFFIINKDEFVSIRKKLIKIYNAWKNGEINTLKIREIAKENSWEQRGIILDQFYRKIYHN